MRDQHRAALQAVGVHPIDDDVLDQQIPSPGPTTGLHRGTASGHELFRRVVELVRRDRSQLYGAYFVLVAAETELGTTARALRHMGVDPTALAEAARAEISLLNNGEH